MLTPPRLDVVLILTALAVVLPLALGAVCRALGREFREQLPGPRPRAGSGSALPFPTSPPSRGP